MAGRLGSFKPKEVIRKLKKAGFREDRQSGSHVLLINSEGRRTTVPVHAKEMKRGLLADVVKQAGLTLEEFQAL